MTMWQTHLFLDELQDEVADVPPELGCMSTLEPVLGHEGLVWFVPLRTQ